jgi:ADP-heptose:LPS heptosyltransferase
MQKPSHILLIRLSAMGDVAMVVPVLRILSNTYPELKITVVSKGFFKPFFDDIPNVGFLEADVYGEHKGLGLRKISRNARKLGIDAVADLHNVIRSKAISLHLKINGIKSITIDKGRSAKKALTRHQDKVFMPLKSTHQRYADVFSQLGYSVDLEKQILPVRKGKSAKLQTLMGLDTKKFIGIAPYAAYKSKMYPLESMKEVISKLDAQGTFKIFLFGGGQKEIESLRAMEMQFQSVTCIAGSLTFEEELALISNLDLMLSMDSGNGHIAAMYGVPVVTLWGVTHPFAGFAPFGQPKENSICSDRSKYPLIPTSIYGNKYLAHYETAMDTITPKQIIDKILEVL